MTEATTAVVAGGGLAGLVAARRLADAGVDVTLFERREETGGRVRSRREGEFTVDRGFQVLFTAYPAARRELDLDALELRRFAKGAVLARDGERSVLADPLSVPGSLVETLFNREVTTSDKLRTLALRQHLRGRTAEEIFAGPDQSVRAYLREWGFSDRFVENFAAPFYGGITLDRSLSTSARVFAYTFRMLSEGHAAVPADGMGAIPAQLEARVRDAGATVHLGEAVEALEDDGGVAVTTGERTVEADAAVVATDPPTARRLTGVDSVPLASRGCVTQYYRLPDATPLDAGRKLLLNLDGADPNAVAPLSTVAPEYAPDDDVLLSATFLGRGGSRPADDLAAATRSALASWYPERSFDAMETVTTERVEFAQFEQPPGVHDDLPGLRAAGGRTYLAGDYTAWSSIQGALQSGREAAEALLADR